MIFLKKLNNHKDEIVNGLSPIDISNLYSFLCFYEQEIKKYPGSFDITKKTIDKFINKQDIYLDTCNKKKLAKAKKHKYYFLYDQQKNSKASKNDKAHHLLRHIRNSIAHGRVKISIKDKKTYEMTDFNGYRNTMYGLISLPVLYQLITILFKSKKK